MLIISSIHISLDGVGSKGYENNRARFGLGPVLIGLGWDWTDGLRTHGGHCDKKGQQLA